MDTDSFKDKIKKRCTDSWGTLYQNIVTLIVTLYVLPHIKNFLYGCSIINNSFADKSAPILAVVISATLSLIIIVLWDFLREKMFSRGKILLNFYDKSEGNKIGEFIYNISRVGYPIDRVLFSIEYELSGQIVYCIFKRFKLGISLVFDPDVLQLDVDGVKAKAVEVSDTQNRLFIPIVTNSGSHTRQKQSISSLELCFKPGSIIRDYTFLVARVETNIRWLKWLNWLFNTILSDIVIGSINDRYFKIKFEEKGL